MIWVFDLDDTLYPEITFVESGFKEVAQWLDNEFGLNKNEAFKQMLQLLEEKGRGEIFNDVLKKHNLFSKQLLKKCIQKYRLHYPEIKLYPEAKSCLERLRNFPLYVVTDGHKIVQSNKVKALQLNKYVKHVYITYRYGIKRSKPSPYCFELIAKKENAPFDEIAYVADNPNKDFIGIKPYGLKTIRVLQGYYKDLKMDNEHEADVNIRSLDELTPKCLHQHFQDSNINRISNYG